MNGLEQTIHARSKFEWETLVYDVCRSCETPVRKAYVMHAGRIWYLVLQSRSLSAKSLLTDVGGCSVQAGIEAGSILLQHAWEAKKKNRWVPEARAICLCRKPHQFTIGGLAR